MLITNQRFEPEKNRVLDVGLDFGSLDVDSDLSTFENPKNPKPKPTSFFKIRFFSYSNLNIP